VHRDRSDEELVRRFLDGDGDAFGELVRRNEDRIFGLASRMLGDRSEALDATQDAFVQAWRKASSFRGDSAFATWLYRIAVNACHDILRRRARTPVPDEDLPEPEPAGGNVGDAVATRIDVTRALAQLNEDYREAVVMHDIGGLPYEEIAQITGVELGTVKSRISRGRRRLAELLEQPAPERTSKDQR
jgi:RNA polymerase sigma-70 factor, ECF subfamily